MITGQHVLFYGDVRFFPPQFERTVTSEGNFLLLHRFNCTVVAFRGSAIASAPRLINYLIISYFLPVCEPINNK
jgi:hypothetical protein